MHRLRPVGPLHRRRQLSGTARAKAPWIRSTGPSRVRQGQARTERHYQLTVPCLLVSTDSPSPALNRNASMFRVRKVRACGSITFKP